MKREEGFALLEVLVATSILAVLSLVLMGLTQNILLSWDRTEMRIDQSRDLANLAIRIQRVEAGNDVEVLLFDDVQLHGEEIPIASSRIDANAECVFDLVGRRCR